MSILAALGGAPSSFTVPLTVAAVAGSMAVAAGAAAAGAAGRSSVVSFFPHPAKRMSPKIAGRASIAFHIFLFMISLHLSSGLKLTQMEILLRGAMTGAAGGFRAGRAARRSRAPHGCSHAPLLLRRQLEDVIDEQFCLVLIVTLEQRRRRAGEHPMIVFPLEKAGWHGRARADGLRVDDPALHPIRFQAPSGLQEVRRRCRAIVSGIAGGVALQTRRRRTAEQAARHLGFLCGEHRDFFRYVGERLPRKGLEEADELAQFVFGKREGRHVDLQIGADAIAIGVLIVQRRIFQEAQHPLGIDARTLGEELWRELLLSVGPLITGHSHQGSLLAGGKLVATHAVIFLYDPPTLLNIVAIIQGAILIACGERILLATEEKSGEGLNFVFAEVQIRHAQLFSLRLDLALVPNIRLG